MSLNRSSRRVARDDLEAAARPHREGQAAAQERDELLADELPPLLLHGRADEVAFPAGLRR